MTWKIVTLDYDADKPCIHFADPRPFPGVHMLIYFDKTIEVFVGAAFLHDCPVRAVVTSEHVRVEALRFTRLHVKILMSVLASLDVTHPDRVAALAWMDDTMTKAPDSEGFWPGNRIAKNLAPQSGWPFDLDDADLLSALHDPHIPKPRYELLRSEVERRGL